MDEDVHTLDKKLQESFKKSLDFDGELEELLGVFNEDLEAFVERIILKLMN